MQKPQNVRIEGIRQTNVRTWAVVGSLPITQAGMTSRATILVSEHRGIGAKAEAIREAGTNRVVTEVVAS